MPLTLDTNPIPNFATLPIIGGAALLIAVVVVLALRERWQPVPPLEVPVAVPTDKVRVRAVECKAESVAEGEVVAASGAVAIVCGEDAPTADRYEARNDALRSIARRRDLPEKDVAALIAYLRAADDAMRVERVAALKNDVMNLLRTQKPPSKDLAWTLIGIFEGGNHPPVVIDYCIQHLGLTRGQSPENPGERPCNLAHALAKSCPDFVQVLPTLC